MGCYLRLLYDGDASNASACHFRKKYITCKGRIYSVTDSVFFICSTYVSSTCHFKCVQKKGFSISQHILFEDEILITFLQFMRSSCDCLC